MSRCLLVATDGLPAGQAALRHAIDFASATLADEIACLCVSEHAADEALMATPLVMAGEMALSGCVGPVLVGERSSRTVPLVDADAVLDRCAEQVGNANLRITAITTVGDAGLVDMNRRIRPLARTGSRTAKT